MKQRQTGRKLATARIGASLKKKVSIKYFFLKKYCFEAHTETYIL
jgi:hypothetical protein